MLEDGWYLMSTPELEQELRSEREGAAPSDSTAVRLSLDEAINYRNAGNLPDREGRTLRLVLRVPARLEPGELERLRLAFEPDYLDAPRWRREGSRPVNVVPLRSGTPEYAGSENADVAWWDEPGVAPLEQEWRATGAVAGVVIPEAIRSFVFKTVLALKAADRPVTPDSIADSVSRWLAPNEADRIRDLLREANRL